MLSLSPGRCLVSKRVGLARSWEAKQFLELNSLESVRVFYVSVISGDRRHSRRLAQSGLMSGANDYQQELL